MKLEKIGPPVRNLVTLPLPHIEVGGNTVQGEVLYIDHFGNIVTSIGRIEWEEDRLVLRPAFCTPKSAVMLTIPAGQARVRIGGHELTRVRRTYGEVNLGDPLLLVGSSGFLEVAIRQGNAAMAFNAQPGDPVILFGDES